MKKVEHISNIILMYFYLQALLKATLLAKGVVLFMMNASSRVGPATQEIGRCTVALPNPKPLVVMFLFTK